MTGHVRQTACLALLATLAVALAACRTDRAQPASQAVARGGEAVASIRSEPRAFNRHAARDSATELVSTLTQGKLVRINKVTQDVEPWLAERWTISDDRLRLTLTLRSGILFSDGHPFSADDVLFAFQAAYDERVGSTIADSLQVAGKKLLVAAPDAHTVVITFPTAFAPGVRILNNLPILPRHKLEPALKNGTFASAWNLATPPSDIVGLGPFVLKQYSSGQRLVFERNPHYWRKAADGTQLPYLDRLTVDIVPDQNAELLRLQAGQLDITSSEVSPESYAAVKRSADEGRVKLFDLGVSLDPDSFWFNLKPHAFDGDPRAAWLQRDELRRAISMAVDRKLFADTVFFGGGEPVYGFETAANKKWYSPDLPKTPHDPAGARAVLAGIGLTDRNGDGTLEDAHNQPARFTLVTQKGRPRLERGAAVIKDELKKIGVVVDVAAIDANAVIERIVSGSYEAVLFNPAHSDTDPGSTPDFWFSAGSSHFWNPAQAKPATDWERQIDELMARQIASFDEAERRRLFDQVQRIFSEHQPVLYFAAPRVYVAVSSRLSRVTPAVYIAPVLWDPDNIAVVH